MSQSNAAAIKRRVGQAPPPAPINTQSRNTNVNAQSQPPQAPPAAGLTLQQVIAVMDRRLVHLEKYVQDTESARVATSGVTTENANIASQSQPAEDDHPFNTVIDEFNHRFELLATELDSLKDIIIKLQSYTMEVNKSLLEERIHIFSELGNNRSADVEENETANGLVSANIETVNTDIITGN